jgi:MFS family permease
MSSPKSGLRENIFQFSLLVVINAMVGAMLGTERSIIPALAESEFGLSSNQAILMFIAVFGLSKALTNYAAGTLSDKMGRRPLLLIGWAIAMPVPLLLMWAPSWGWMMVANALLGISQGLTWSTTVIMKIDLAGPKRRGLAMGINECAGYLALGLSALATSHVADVYGLRPAPFILSLAFVIVGTALSVLGAKETKQFALAEQKNTEKKEAIAPETPSMAEVFITTSLKDPDLSAACQAGMVNNLNDGMAWGLFPIIFAAASLSTTEIGLVAALYPSVWGLAQLFTGAWSDKYGRKIFIVSGMWVQAIAIGIIGISSDFGGFAAAAVLLGIGTAMVYPTLIAAVADKAAPAWRASAVGIYRLWRDLGYVVGALLTGAISDHFGTQASVAVIALLTFVSGAVVALRMKKI